MGGMGGGMGGMGGGGGFFNVPAEKVGQFKVATVCLDFGKGEPRAAIPYEIKPIESYVSKPEVQELCRLLGQGGVNQRVAQLAAWRPEQQPELAGTGIQTVPLRQRRRGVGLLSAKFLSAAMQLVAACCAPRRPATPGRSDDAEFRIDRRLECREPD